MGEKTLAEIPRQLRELYEKGNAALQKRNFDYAIAIYNQVLTQEPGFYDCRAALRACQLNKAGSGGGFLKKVFGAASNSPSLAKAQLLVRSNPREALNACEQILNNDPNSAAGNKLLAEAAMSLSFPKTAVLSLEIAYKNSPRDREIAMNLAEALSAAGQISRGEMILTELKKSFPGDPEIDQTLKNLAAKKTLREGGYDALAGGAGSYRDILRDKAQATALEQENRTVKSEDVAQNLIAEYTARLENEPENKNLLRRIADLYLQQKQFEQALQYFQRISATDAGADPAIEKAITDTRVKWLELQAEQLDPDDPEFEARRKALEKEKEDLRINDAKARVDRYPNDLQHRYDLGRLLFDAGRIGEAIPEFQKAQVNPNRKVSAMFYLGQCFARRNMHDLAAETLQAALNEKQGFDEEKKQMLYALGTVFEKMGKSAEAIAEFKKIYIVDSSYKDVAKKIDDFYASGS